MNIDAFINNWKELNQARIGLEFEFFSNYDYIKTLELLNNIFNPIEVYGFNTYHSDFLVTNNKFKIEPDFSGGSEMIELITGPLEYSEAKLIISKMLSFIKKYGYTTDKSSIHINVSFKDINVSDMKPVKLILNLNEDYIYSKFPDRKNNIYAKSIKYIMPFEQYTDTEYGLNNTLNSFKIPDNSKYYGVNFQKQVDNYLEFRYIGGEKYEDKKDDIYSCMNYFILELRKSILDDYTQDDYILLTNYLSDNINWYKQFSSYDTFLMNIENIELEIDCSNDYNVLVKGWDLLYKKLFSFIKECKETFKCKINYNTFSNRLEVIDANINGLTECKNVDFINCNLNNVTLINCDIIDSYLDNSHLYKCNIYNSKVNNSKINNSLATKYTELINCFFDDKILDCDMNGGIFRSGTITGNANISNDVKMSTGSDFWMISKQVNKKIKEI